MDDATPTTTPAPFSPEWYAWHAATAQPSRYDRIVGGGFNAVVGALMATIGWRS